MFKHTIPIVYATNNGYAPYAGVSINSLIKNSSKEFYYDIYVFHTDLNFETVKKLENLRGENYEVRCLCVSSLIEKELKMMQTNFHFSKEMYYRILIPSVLSKYNKAVYLDCDTVVLGDISEFYNTDLSEHIIGGVQDIMHAKSKNYVANELGLDPYRYINSGVLLLNCERFRKENVKEEFFKELSKGRKLRYPDQDLINLVCLNKIKFLDYKWNHVWNYLIDKGNPDLRLPKEEFLKCVEDSKDIRILHFTSNVKPWNNKNISLSDRFWQYVPKSAFEAQILKEYSSIPRKNYIGLQFLDYNEKSITVQAALYSLEGLSCDDVTVKINNTLTEKRELFNHSVEISNRLYNRYFFEFSVNVNDIIAPLKVEFSVKGNGSKLKIVTCKYFPVDVNCCPVFETEYFAVQCDGNALTLAPSKKDIKVKRIDKKHRKGNYFKFKLLRAYYNITKLFYRKKIWFVSDRTNFAGDNGEAFFRFLQNGNLPKGVKAYFVLEKSSPDYGKIRKIGPVLDPKSLRYKLKYLHCSKNITSSLEQPISEPIWNTNYIKDIIHKCKNVFLQHGIIKDDLSNVYNRHKKNLDIFITSVKPEYNSIVNNAFYNCGEKITKLTGLSRYDNLSDEREKIVFIAPTWRKNTLKNFVDCALKDGFEESSYYKFYRTLLRDERLIESAKKHGYKLCFYPHVLMRNSNKYFEDLDKEVFLDRALFTYNDMFKKGALLVTDYSSIPFDFVYLNKPVVYCQFDRKEFFSSHTYTEGYFDYTENGFGECLFNYEDSLETILSYIENDCELKDKYKERIDSFFFYHDKNNSKRILDEILKLDKERL